ncbi:hypothetical protein [Listeria grayi]|uniref:hypothetical protein n=1 Tax=Listeria grayi TaxID=1641 RepID=UPI0004B56B51|nr:hypothetical protein [Listeria grayi]
MPNRLKEDTEAINKNDPATRGFWDAVITNPGLHALWWHRVAHFFLYASNAVIREGHFSICKIFYKCGDSPWRGDRATFFLLIMVQG